MANLNKIVKRKQVALLIALSLGIGLGGAVSWMASNMNLKKESAPRKAKEPPPNMTGVVNDSFDGKVEQSAVAEAKRLNGETQRQLKGMQTQVQALSRELKASQETVNQLRDDNDNLQSQINTLGQGEGRAGDTPVPSMLAENNAKPPVGQVPVQPPTNFWPAPGAGSTPANGVIGGPELSAVARPGHIETTSFDTPNPDVGKPKYPWISSGSFAEAVVIEGADANASVTGDKNMAPMQIRLTGKVQMPNDDIFDLRGCFVTLAAYGDVSSERAEVRTRSISCRFGQDIIDQEIKGHVSFMGKNGIKGEVVMRNGKILGFAFGAGFLDGIGKGIEQGASTTVGVGATSSMSGADIAQAGVGGGVGTAAKTLSDYYIKRAEQYHPIIPIGAGNDVTLVFQDGFQLETLQEALAKKNRRQAKPAPSESPGLPSTTPDMLKQLKDFKLGDAVAPASSSQP